MNSQEINIKPMPDIGSSTIKVHFSNRMINIPLEKIVRLEADCNYTTVFTHTHKFISAKTIGLYEALLNKDFFVRVHKKHIVNVRHVIGMEMQKFNAELEMEGGKKVEVSRRKLKNVVQMIETYK